MGRYTWILDPGHGGLGPGGEYLTPGKRSPQVPPGVYEGEFNRDICAQVEDMCSHHDIVTTITNPGPVNAGLLARVKYIKALQRVRRNCVVLSIHANAAKGSGWSTAHGAVTFHHPKDKKGVELATRLLDSLWLHTHLTTDRGVKLARFFVLSTGVPSALVECGFMTSRYDVETLAESKGREDITKAIIEVIRYFEINGGL